MSNIKYDSILGELREQDGATTSGISGTSGLSGSSGTAGKTASKY